MTVTCEECTFSILPVVSHYMLLRTKQRIATGESKKKKTKKKKKKKKHKICNQQN